MAQVQAQVQAQDRPEDRTMAQAQVRTACTYGMVTCHTAHRIAPAHDHDGMVRRMLAWYAAASPQDIAEGRVWYSEAGATLRAASLAAGYAEHVGIVIAAILSPRSDWAYNLPAALAMLRGEAPTGPVLPERVAIARAFVATNDLGLNATPKTQPFACNLSGCPDCVTCDTWHARAALGTWDVSLNGCGCDHAAIAAATRAAAAIVGESPAAFQAIVWVAIRRANPRGSRSHVVAC